METLPIQLWRWRVAMMVAQRRMRHVTLAIGLLFASAAPAALPSDNPHSSALDQAVEASLAKSFGGPCHVGLSLAVVQGGRAQFYNYGERSRGGASLPRPDTIYEIASVTKSFTGALAAKAIADGKVTLDGDFRAYLPGAYPNLSWHGRPITLRTLATHRSGLPRDIPDTDPIFARHDFDTITRDLIAAEKGYDRKRYLADLHSIALRSSPGARFVYSNIAMKVIGFGLETAYRLPFATLMTRFILQPLQMKDTGFDVPTTKRARLAKGYGRDGLEQPYHLANAGAAYGLYSTAGDMARYARWQLSEQDPVIRRAHRRLAGSASDGAALIWNVGVDRGARLLWHGGGTFGMTSQLVLYPDAREAYVLLGNDSCAGTEGALKAIALDVHAWPAGSRPQLVDPAAARRSSTAGIDPTDRE
ncbi:serine hydrolase domain-containing protein [Sphingomonas crusticola]|uniref:serine hydrolase domain-containing protein n=1 Tax=Sphingomonas crusticola TaxID=1697973 RepID=UPI000E27CA65|nr:serine hydrolase domain-containing protein [Sphingomonas crusticola]